MKKTLHTIIFLGILSALNLNCGSDKGSLDNARIEKITFPAEEFSISATTDTTLFGTQGTRIFIEKGTFQFVDGSPVTDSIKIELKEFYKKSDILLAELSTESDGKMLETGGMLNILATSSGRKIEIKSDKRIVVHFPKKTNSFRKMDLFYPGPASTDSSVNNWDVDTVNLVKRTLKLGSFGWYLPEHGDSTGYNFTPKNYLDTGYHWNPIDFYISSYNFSDATKKEVETTMNKNSYPDFGSWNDYGVECEMEISIDGFIKNPKVITKVSKDAKQEIIKFLKDLPQLEPGKNKYGKIIERRGLLFIQGGNIIPLYKTREEYMKSFSNKYSKFEKSPIKSIDDAELSYYIFSVAKLGWINCDRFLESEQLTDFLVKTPVDNDVKIKMVFTDIDGVLQATNADGNYVFSKVPVGRRVTIFAIKNTKGHFQTAFQDLTISAKPIEALAFKETTLAELKQQLEKLN